MMQEQTDLSLYDNRWYRPGNPVKRLVWYMINSIFFRSSIFPFYKLKLFLLRTFGARLGKGVLIKPRVNIKYPWLLSIDDHSWIGEDVWIDNLAPVTVGKNVCLSQGALLLSGNHNYSDKKFSLQIKPIILEDGVWIGAKAIVAGGSICRSHAVLVAGSVCSGELDAYSIWRGNPAVKVKDRKIEK